MSEINLSKSPYPAIKSWGKEEEINLAAPNQQKNGFILRPGSTISLSKEIPAKKEIKVVFRRLAQDEKIPWGAYHSLTNGENLNPIFNADSVGQTPADFADDRSFWVLKK